MRPFAGQHFTMNTYWDVKEPSDFTKRIGKDALISAGWMYVRPDGFLIGLVTGVEVQLSKESEFSAKAAANELVAALVAEGVNADISYDPTYKTLIVIQVGVKQ